MRTCAYCGRIDAPDHGGCHGCGAPPLTDNNTPAPPPAPRLLGVKVRKGATEVEVMAAWQNYPDDLLDATVYAFKAFMLEHKTRPRFLDIDFNPLQVTAV